jgi:hypothetical protein
MLHLAMAWSGRMRVISVVVCLLSIAAGWAQALGAERASRLRAAGPKQRPALLFSGSEIGLGTLYPAHLDLVQRYVAAMTLYGLAPNEDDLKTRVLALEWVGTDRLPDAFRLVWTAPNGNTIARIGKGLFRISYGNYRTNWFQNLDCRLMNWSGGESEAAVSCTDGKDRRMLVAGSGLIEIENVQYRRVFPMDWDIRPSLEPETGSIEPDPSGGQK